jgi:membrane-associated phospholipid phosphatase
MLGAALPALLSGFAGLAVFVAGHPLPPALAHEFDEFDEQLRAYPGQERYDLVTTIRAVGAFPVVVTLALMAGVLLWRRWHQMDLAVICMFSPLLAGAVGIAVKQLVERDVSRTAALEGAFGYGFPSGHAVGTAALAAAGMIAVLELSSDPRLRLCSACVALGVVLVEGTSNVVIGAHRSLDVLGGVLLGVAATLTPALCTWSWAARDTGGTHIA